MKKVKIYDTTLRDGSQSEGVSFSLNDKLRIAQKLDEFGVHYLEGGWPGSNPKDIEFFEKVKSLKLKRIRVTAFGSTRRKDLKASADPNLKALIDSRTDTVTIFGKTWDLHVREALKATLEENLDMISDSVRYLKTRVEEVIYDAEHFFDGYKGNREYAIGTLKAAAEAGADTICLCDTNGGSLPGEIRDIIIDVGKHIKTPLGIHTHNDGELGVANTLAAVLEGCSHVQGTINGYGERCGNVNLCSVIPNLQLKMGYSCIAPGRIKDLTYVSRYISELANMMPNMHQPFTGASAFAHKGGIHVSAVMRNPRTYEHIEPSAVGNRRRVLVSELSGRSNIIEKASEFNIDLSNNREVVTEVLDRIKSLEHEGYQFEGAESSFELIIKKALKDYKKFFTLKGFRVIVEKKEDGSSATEATIKIEVNGEMEHTAAEGDGPVNAMDNALRKALEKFYPEIRQMRLNDYKVRVIDGKAGTLAKVRVLAESTDKADTWGTIGVSENIIEASWQAIVDGIEYMLLKNKGRKKMIKKRGERS